MLTQLRLHHFRNYESATFHFAPGLNRIAGPNGIGKTNILEALSLLSTGRSFRSHSVRDLITFGEASCHIEATFLRDGATQRLSLSYLDGRRQMRHNDAPLTTHADLLGLFPSIIAAPSDIDLIHGSPSLRRRFLNIHIAQKSRHYAFHLLRYTQALKQRNTLLKQRSLEDIEVWEKEMLISALFIMEARKEAIEELTPLVAERASHLSGEPFTITYAPSLREGKTFEKSRERDMQLGATSIGPHRDELLFMIDGKEMRLIASEGQKRTALTALRLAQLDHAPEGTLLCIDDFAAHLDETRRGRLFDEVAPFDQVVMTAPLREERCDIAEIAIGDGK